MATSVPTPTFGPRGFIAPATAEVLAGVFEDINNAFGGNLNPSLDTPQGQIATSEAAVIDEVNATFLYYTTQTDPAFAEGRMQDAIARIYFIERIPSQPTVVQVLCSGLEGVVIPVGSQAIAQDGTRYQSTGAGTIGPSGEITLPFAALLPGPVPCPANTLTQIYQAIPGWDSVDNPTAGVTGNDTESRAEFEARRAASVALNSIGSLPSVLGAVLSVDGVIDAYVTENTDNSPQVIGGVSLLPNSLYVAAVGGLASDIAQAIWSKKAPGCAYNGNTNVTVYDTSPGYVPPYPAYSVSFEVPDALPIVFRVELNDTTMVPADALEQVQAAIVAAFSGQDGGQRARIGTTLYASRFYAPVALLGSWVQIVSITIGSPNAAAAEFTAAIAGTTMTVSAVGAGTLAVDQMVLGTGVLGGPVIVSQDSGTPGGIGTYTLSNSQTVGSRPMVSVAPVLNEIDVRIDQVPTVDASNIELVLT